jgi:hypothetical protein
MSLATSLRQVFPASAFGPPATTQAIESAETLIGSRIPTPLRELYLEFDGFYGPTGIPFFYRLGDPEDDPSLVYWNLFFRTGKEFARDFMRGYLFFGSDGCGGHWAVPLSADSATIVRWYPDMGNRVERLSEDFVAFWTEQKGLYGD